MTYRIDDEVGRLLAEHGVSADDFNDEIERQQLLVPILASERVLMLAAAFYLRWRKADELAKAVCVAHCNGFQPARRRGRRS